MKALLLTFNLLCVGDALSTHAVLNGGGRELLLPSQNPWTVDGIIAAQALTMDVIAYKLRKKHRAVAIGLLVGMTLARGYAVTNNVMVLREMHR